MKAITIYKSWTDEQIIEFAEEFRHGILDGGNPQMMCAMVCLPLAGLLSFYGIECEIVEVDLGDCNHVFLRLRDGRVLDPTADQFTDRGCTWPPVYLGPPTELHRNLPS